MNDGRLVNTRQSSALGEAQGRQEGLTARDLVRVLWRRKWTLAAFVAVGLLLGYFYVSSARPIYAAEALVALEEVEEVVQFGATASPVPTTGSSAKANMEVLVLTSRNLLESVVDSLELTGDPEFNPALRPPSVWRTWFASASADEAGVEPDPEMVRQRAVDILLSKLLVEVENATEAFSIRVETWSAPKSTRITNAIAESYITDQLEAKFESTQRAAAWLSERVADLKGELELAEAAVEEHAAASPLISEEALAAQSRQLKELRERRKQIEEQRQQLSRELADLDASDTEPAGAEQNIPVDQARIRQRLDQLASQSEVLKRSISEGEALLAARSDDMVEQRQLQREAEATRVLYEYFLSRVKEISAKEGMQQPDARILSEAVVRPRPVYPKEERMMFLAGALALVLGGVSVLFSEQMNQSVRSVRELQRLTEKPVFGAIPEAPIRRRRGALLEYMRSNPTSAFCEAVRDLRTSIELTSLDRPPKVILVSSSVPAEGKSTLSVAIAASAAAAGKRVLLVDCDLRRRSLEGYFAPDGRPDLVAVLAGKASFGDAVYQDDRSGLDVLLTEEMPMASEIFASNRFEGFVGELRKHYDLVVLDSPPVLAVSDSRTIARHVDVAVFAVRWNSTEGEVVQSAVDSLDAANVPMVGLTLTRYNARRMAEYYGGYGSYKAVSKYYT